MLSFLFAAAISADTVILKNGVIIEGVVYDQNPHMLRVQRDKGSAITIRKSQVIRVIYGDRPVEELKPETREKPEPRPQPPRPAERKAEEPKKPVKPEPRESEEKPEEQEEQERMPESANESETAPDSQEKSEEEAQIIQEPLPEPIPVIKDMSGPLADPLSSRYVGHLDKTPRGISKKELSRAHSLKYGEGEESQELILRDRPHSQIIDLNRIVVGPIDPDERGRLRIHSDEDGQPVALVEVDYSRAGLNVPQAIRDGRILEHEVLLRNHEGEILGRAPLNFSSFRFERITEQKKARKLLILPNATSVTVEEAEDPEPQTRIVAHIKNYTDRDSVPQSIELKEPPNPDYPVSLQVRMTLIDPYLIALCRECLEDPLYARARKDYEDSLKRLRELEANPDLLKEESSTEIAEAPQEIAQLAHKRADDYRKSVKEAIQKMNEASHKIKNGKIENHTSEGNFIQYREWHLYSRPYFFRISTEKAN